MGRGGAAVLDLFQKLHTLTIGDLRPGRYAHGWACSGGSIVLSLQNLRSLRKLDMFCRWEQETFERKRAACYFRFQGFQI